MSKVNTKKKLHHLWIPTNPLVTACQSTSENKEKGPRFVDA